MTKILQPPDLKSILQPILDRLDILERQPARALEVKDSTGLTRIRAGIAPQTNDLAAYDASGRVIWDTVGLAGAMVRVGSNFAGGPNVVNTATPTDVPNCSTTFNVVNRPQNILCLAKWNMTVVTQPVSVRLAFTLGGTTLIGAGLNCGALGTQMPAFLFYDQSRQVGGSDNRLAVGLWTAKLQGFMATTPGSASIENFDIVIYQFGG